MAGKAEFDSLEIDKMRGGMEKMRIARRISMKLQWG